MRAENGRWGPAMPPSSSASVYLFVGYGVNVRARHHFMTCHGQFVCRAGLRAGRHALRPSLLLALPLSVAASAEPLPHLSSVQGWG
jgi:hypothetical protein